FAAERGGLPHIGRRRACEHAGRWNRAAPGLGCRHCRLVAPNAPEHTLPRLRDSHSMEKPVEATTPPRRHGAGYDPGSLVPKPARLPARELKAETLPSSPTNC